ncbi:hypothetical protein HFD88_003826 [Aspergillus terreus]|nr:hypothetical protein HFD88_003826 [Aspergillus terreus]
MWVQKNIEAIAFVSGVVTHIFYFRKGEHHLYPFRYLYTYVGLSLTGAALLHYDAEAPVIDATRQSISLICIHLLGLYSSLLVYRLFLHPLRRFPGPFGARISGFWMPMNIRYQPPYQLLEDLHRKYGDFVRIGPSDISVTNPKAITAIHGLKSRCIKGPLYDFNYPVLSMQTMRSKEDHHQRRRIWNPGFTESAVRGYEKRVRPYRQQFMSHIASASDDGKPLDISEVCQWYSYDVISDLALGKSYGGLQKGVRVPIAQSFIDANTGLRNMYPPWFYRLIVTSPMGSQEWKEFNDRIWQDLMERMKSEPDVPDIYSYFLAPLKGQRPRPDDIPRLLGDALLLIGAGGDTTGMTLAVAIYELARRPEEVKKLRDELACCSRELGGEYAHENIASLRHLNGFINEVQRMHAGVPSQLPRKTPPEGLDIDGTYVPGYMNILSPHREIGRSEAAFEKPQEFIPERWYLHPNMVKDKSAHAPFSTGSYGCIGKPLALMNLRTTLAQLVMTYELELAPGDDGFALERNMDELFSIYIHNLYVVFREREL